MQKDSILGLKIAYYRKLNGLTQEELAEKVGVSTQAVSKWEQQLSCPDIMLLFSELCLFLQTFIYTQDRRKGPDSIKNYLNQIAALRRFGSKSASRNASSQSAESNTPMECIS